MYTFFVEFFVKKFWPQTFMSNIMRHECFAGSFTAVRQYCNRSKLNEHFGGADASSASGACVPTAVKPHEYRALHLLKRQCRLNKRYFQILRNK